MGKIVTRAQQQYVSTGIGSGEKQLAYVLRPVRYSTMGANDIVDYCAANSIVPKAYMVAAMTAIIQCIENFLLNGHSVELPNFGIFSLTSKGIIATDADAAGLAQLEKLKVKFLPNIRIKQAVENVALECEGVYDIAGYTEHENGTRTPYYSKRGTTRGVEGDGGDEDDPGSGSGSGSGFLLTLSVPTAMQSMGKVQIGSDTPGTSVSKTIASGQEVTIKAIPTSGDYQFNSWSDNNTSSTRTLTLTEAMSLTASFSPVE